jgi:hypothetical protein
MNNHTITTGREFPLRAIAIALALAAVVSILAMQGMALVASDTTHPVVVQQGSSDLGSSSSADSVCGIKSSHTPRWCFSGSAGRGNTGRLPGRPTLRQIVARRS